MEDVKTITFFYPSKIVGGAELLFIRLAEFLAEKYNIQVFYIDYKDGFARSQLNSEKITFVDYEINNKTTIDYETYIITPVSKIYTINNELNLTANVKPLFWCIQPYNIIWQLPGARYYVYFKFKNIKTVLNLLFKKELQQMRTALKLLYENNALVFMDFPNFDINNYCFDLNFDKKNYLPIPILEGILKANVSLISNDELNVGWLGRISDEKTNCLINLVENADAYSKINNKKLKLHIIGSGSDENKIKKLRTNENLKLIHLGTVKPEELDSYLINNIDLLFAMGTSCLESAKLHIPSVLYDFSYKKLHPDYKFKWLFESFEYNLGQHLEELMEPNKHLFAEILDEIYLNNNKELIGNKCYSYFKENHSIEKVSNLLINCLKNNNLTYEKS